MIKKRKPKARIDIDRKIDDFNEFWLKFRDINWQTFFILVWDQITVNTKSKSSYDQLKDSYMEYLKKNN